MKCLFVYGTRPEAIKMAPLIKAMEEHEKFTPIVCLTGQHREMLDQANEFFSIKPEFDLNVMTHNQSLCAVTNKILSGLESAVSQVKPNAIVVQGDTTSTFVGALCGYYSKVPVFHVEAGLRTGDIFSPFPEEGNRLLTSKIAELHFAPTHSNKENLVKEGINSKKIYVTGNTGIDALFLALNILRKKPHLIDPKLSKFFEKPMILLTAHRRESFGHCFEGICDGMLKIASEFPNWNIVYPLHPNPNVQKIVSDRLEKPKNIHLIQPLNYPNFIYMMQKSKIIITDSGGIQEEAPSLGKPVLMIRDKTERQEALKAESVKLIGTKSEFIYHELKTLIKNESLRDSRPQKNNPYGDGAASKKILSSILEIN